MSNRRVRRTGAFTIAAVITLSVVASVAFVAMHAATRWRRQVRVQQQLMQTDLLLDAGIARLPDVLDGLGQGELDVWRVDDAFSFQGEAIVETKRSADVIYVTASLRIRDEPPVNRSIEISIGTPSERSGLSQAQSHPLSVEPSDLATETARHGPTANPS